MTKTLRSHPLRGGGYQQIMFVSIYHEMVAVSEIHEDARLLERIRMKPMRTLSGATTVTVLTKPYPCPANVSSAPPTYGCQNPIYPMSRVPCAAWSTNSTHTQVRSRIEQLQSVGHPTDKIELLILGGTWSSYRRDYQEWFIKRCFDAMNSPSHALGHSLGRGRESAQRAGEGELLVTHSINETTHHRNVGLVIETRPDEIDPKELRWLRTLA